MKGAPVTAPGDVHMGEGRESGRRARAATRPKPPGGEPSRLAARLAASLIAASALAACGGGGGGGTSRESAGPAASPVGVQGGPTPDAGGAGADPGAEDSAPPVVLVPIGQAPLNGELPDAGRPGGRPGRPAAAGTPVRTPVASVTPGDLPSQLQQFEDDPNRLEPLPDVAHVEVLADSGLQIVYTTDAQLALVSPAWVEAQWQHMQRCTGVVAPPPVVLIVEDEARPLTPEDDVVLDIDGIALASASSDAAGTTLQVVDFDLAPGTPGRGFALRAIMGRWLWQGASLPDRDYPFACAGEEASPDA